MFDQATLGAIDAIATRHGYEAAALKAVAEVESGGTAFAIVDGRKEPLIRFEGHYFDRRLDGEAKAKARDAGLASPKAGAVMNPKSQAARWRLLNRAAAIDAEAAFEACSWGIGQVMGAHWQWLGFKSVTAMVNLCRRDVAGQVELMAKYIDKAGLAGALKAKDWRAFARGYNGPGFAKNAYDTKMAAAYRRYAKSPKPAAPAKMTVKERSAVLKRGSKGEFVSELQANLNALGFGPAIIDGEFGHATEKAVKKFQGSAGLKADGWAGPRTQEAIGKALQERETAPKMRAAEEVVDQAASGEKGLSKTEIVTGITGISGVTAAAKEIAENVSDGASSLASLGPWILLGLVLAGGAAFVIYDRRKKRLAARAAQEAMR